MTRTLEDAMAARDEGIRRAAEAAGSVVGDDGRADIGETVYDAIVMYLAGHRLFHIDDFWVWAAEYHDGWRALGLDPGRYIGAQIQKVVRRRMMAKIDVRHVCRSPVATYAARSSVRSHLAPKWVFESLIYRDTP